MKKKPAIVNKRAATSADEFVGAQLRAARVTKKMSQSDAGEAVGVSFQQIQKYERGTNRVGASRLQQLALLYGKPVDWFMPPSDKIGKAISRDLGAEMLADSFGRRMIEAWLELDGNARQSLLMMASTLAGRVERDQLPKVA